MSTFLLNSTIGEYQLVDFLGAGGMGEVYRGLHTKIGRVAAIKVLTVAARREPGFVERFFNEARIQASLQHPNIATLYDFLVFQGQPCIIMEYVDGETLCDRVRPVGPMHPAEALQIFAAVVEAIAYIHSHNIIHRDIKSNNIKIGARGQVKLLDFGIAKGNTSPGLTETGSVVGTLEYMSPELLASGHASACSDIWALGVLLYEMATGRVPFEAQTLGALCDKISRVDYPAAKQLNPAVPADVVTIISRCLRKNPSERYQTALALLHDVRAAQAALASPQPLPKPKPPRRAPGTPKTTGPYSAPGITVEETWLERNWLKAVGGATALAVVLIAGVIGLIVKFSPSPGEVTPAPAAINSNLKTVTVEMSDGPAQIWLGGRMVGVKEAKVTAAVGEKVTLTLKRDGEEKVVSFEMTENKPVWTFTWAQQK